MFPIRDENPSVHASIATYAIIGINVATWIILQGMGREPDLIRSICDHGLIAGEFLGRLAEGTEVPLGRGYACVTGGQAVWLSPLTSMFMHGGWLHLILNMWFLAIFGDNVEDAMGFTRFIIFYLLCGLGAVFLQVLVHPDSAIPMVGASGAIGGIMGGYALLYPRAPVHLLVFLGFLVTRITVPAYLMLGYWFLLQLLSGLPTIGQATGGVAFMAHVGGFVAGIILVRLFCKANRLQACRKKKGAFVRLFGKSND